MKKAGNFIFVIFGGSGDLSRKKLIPALYKLYAEALLSQNFAVLALGRKEFTDATFRQKLVEDQILSQEKPSVDQKGLKAFCQHLYYHRFDMSRSGEYAQLKTRLETLNKTHKTGGNYLYYLSTPPEFFSQITINLKEYHLHYHSDSEWKRIIIEKPFGHNLKSAVALNNQLLKVFREEQIFRIDHYLGKETVQNILALRFANGIFEPLWNRNYIHHIEITSAEKVGVEERGGYYDNAGALRDMVQNHLLQIAATIAMEPPPLFKMNEVRNEKMKVFQSLRPLNKNQIKKQVIRGQYIGSTIRGQKVNGYRNEKNVNPKSRTETFVAIKFFIDNWRWGGVPFYIRTGKRLPTRVTEVVIYFNKTPHHLFKDVPHSDSNNNQLIIRIQPDEGILLKFGMKVPGAGFKIKNVAMDFHYSDLTDSDIPEAYERLLLDALLGDGTLFARADGVEAAWKFIDPIVQTWETDPSLKIYGYPAGCWGPKEARRLFEHSDEDWRYPCKNLTTEDTYRAL